MDNHPFTGVYRGRVISIAERQRVHGGGLILGGWGGMHVDTVTHNDFWIRNPEFGDLCFKMGVHEPPPMLLDHAVTVVMAGELACAVANHSTGFQRLYRPKGVYKVNKGGWRFLVFTLLALGILGATGHDALQYMDNSSTVGDPSVVVQAYAGTASIEGNCVTSS
jgi:hypothetical protein